ncbi:MAG: hypothetical protein QF568_01875 [Flavobacteriales bacterium]|jgi:tetratricopeptide (TPR) repeat protein|nr:hypothetical protein [Flavobacteriales bacterium]|tara:strand:+ start:3241 stop:3978 length:738 start_codon:yes stop_codon:yes gene_type:complete
MGTQKPNLEDLMIKEVKSGDFSLERALLIASGLTDEKQIDEYIKKIDTLQEGFNKYYSTLPKVEIFKKTQIAEALFKYLWETKPNRYNSNFLLTDVIDTQLSQDKDQKVGNCLGLTSLYTVLGLRNGLDLSVLYNDEHILSVLDDGWEIHIENTERNGFDTDPSNYPYLKKGNLIYIVAGTFHNISYANLELWNPKKAIENCNIAIKLMPCFAKAYHHRSIANEMLGNPEDARNDLNKCKDLTSK